MRKLPEKLKILQFRLRQHLMGKIRISNAPAKVTAAWIARGMPGQKSGPAQLAAVPAKSA
jgi:hypothetical protein